MPARARTADAARAVLRQHPRPRVDRRPGRAGPARARRRRRRRRSPRCASAPSCGSCRASTPTAIAAPGRRAGEAGSPRCAPTPTASISTATIRCPPGTRRLALPGAGSRRPGDGTYCGPAPLSEPETRALHELLRRAALPCRRRSAHVHGHADPRARAHASGLARAMASCAARSRARSRTAGTVGSRAASSTRGPASRRTTCTMGSTAGPCASRPSRSPPASASTCARRLGSGGSIPTTAADGWTTTCRGCSRSSPPRSATPAGPSAARPCGTDP